MTLSKFMANPGHEHYQAALEVLRYLNGTVTLGIGYRSSGNRFPYGYYCDSDFASVESRRSCSGYMFMLAGGPISWKSKLQPKVSLSTCEAEVRAVHTAYEGIREAVWLTKLIEEMGEFLSIEKSQMSLSVLKHKAGPLEIFEDNQAAIATTKNPTSHSRMKHIEPKLYWVRDMVNEGIIKLTYIRSLDQLADSFTKLCIGKESFLAQRAKYMVE